MSLDTNLVKTIVKDMSKVGDSTSKLAVYTRDIDNSLKKLTKAVENLNLTLVEIERNRIKEKNDD